MKELPIKKIIEYNTYSDRRKATMLGNLKVESLFSNNTAARDYWHRSLTAIRKSFRLNDYQFLIDRIESISDDLSKTSVRTTKIMYERNIQILRNFLEFDYKRLLPPHKVRFIPQTTEVSIISVNGIQLKIHGDDLFSYECDHVKHVGAVWFLASKDGYNNDELAIFVDALYRMLDNNLSDDYIVNTDYCLVVDAMKKNILSYSQIMGKPTKSKLDLIVSEISTKL